MSARVAARVIGLLVAASIACNLTGQAAPTQPAVVSTSSVPSTATPALGVTVAAPTATTNAAGNLTAEVLSPAAVRLSWLPLAGAPQYHIEAQYDEGDFFPVATVTGEHTSFDHNVWPGSPLITYRVTAADGAVVGTAPVSLPAAQPNPLKVEGVAFQPTVDPVPTIDISNPVIPDPASYIHPVAVKQMVGPEGGTIVLTSPDQTVYTLDLAPGALTVSALLALTPIESMPGLPLSGGLLGAVKVEPELAFWAPVTLTIQLPAGRTAAAPLTVGFGGSDEFYLMPLISADAAGAQLLLFRGGTFGLGLATAGDLAAQAARLPTDNREQLAQLLAVLSATSPDRAGVYDQVAAGVLAQIERLPQPGASVGRAAGQARLTGPAPNPQQGSLDPGVELWNAINVAEAYWNTRTYDRIADLNGANDARGAAMIAAVAAQIQAFIEQANEKCLTQDDFLVAELIRRFRPPPLGIFWILLAQKYRDTYGEPALDKQCTFELAIKSQIKEDLGDGSYTDTAAHTEDPIRLNLVVRRNELVLQGAGPLTYDKYLFFFSFCPPPQDMQPYPSPVLWITSLTPVFGEAGDVNDFSLNRAMADPIATLTEGSMTSEDDDNGNCHIVNKSQAGTLLDVWSAGFAVMHSLPYGHWTISGGQDEVVATQEIADRTERQLTENSTLTLTVRKVH